MFLTKMRYCDRMPSRASGSASRSRTEDISCCSAASMSPAIMWNWALELDTNMAAQRRIGSAFNRAPSQDWSLATMASIRALTDWKRSSDSWIQSSSVADVLGIRLRILWVIFNNALILSFLEASAFQSARDACMSSVSAINTADVSARNGMSSFEIRTAYSIVIDSDALTAVMMR